MSGCAATSRRCARRSTSIACRADLDGRRVIVCDPMLATGGSLVQVCDLVRARGAEEVIVAVHHRVGARDRRLPRRPPDRRAVLRRRRSRRSTRWATSCPGWATPGTGCSARRTERPDRTDRDRLRGHGPSRPMSSCQSSGCSAMKVPEQLDALGVVEDDDLGPVLGHPVVAADEVLRLADDHGADLELADEPAAVPAGRQGGHHHAVGVVPPAPGVAEGGRLGVGRGVVVLDPPVVAAPEQGPVAVEEGGADGDAALGQPGPGLLEGDGAGTSRACASRERLICGHGALRRESWA